ncbi:potassium/sodium hyperpolarization-activated cyclic nucleotide-gated channel 4-like isoform X2 [Falco biarmicus]|uniref:potassium/sodium hyperpolarization-activated cyclic nucleotide-gated channel 4-like isoform X2 n=1 Tax=Falco biarmicus TaxID=345155 RepID=UPI0024BCDB38|nr:potassium/sodium hyperpolarization-activated cyclic nucleotide-gated channel 4-like isoform X2 [Falco biarmicus]
MRSGYSGSGRRLSCRPPPPPPFPARRGTGPRRRGATGRARRLTPPSAPLLTQDQHPTMPAECGFRVSGGLLIASAPFTSAEGNQDSLSRKTLKNPSGAARWGERGKKLCCSSFPHGGSEAEKMDGGRGPERGLR